MAAFSMSGVLGVVLFLMLAGALTLVVFLYMSRVSNRELLIPWVFLVHCLFSCGIVA